jgi:hypothetical protein
VEHLKKKMEDNAIDALSKPNPSIKDVRDVLNLIIEKMWSEERLAEYIHQVHDSLCANCPHVKGEGEGEGEGEGGKMSGKLIALIGSLVTAVLGLAGAVVKLAMEIK